MIDYEWAEDFAYHKTYVFTDGTITPDEEDDSIWYYSGETYVVENDSLVTESVDIKQGLNSDMQLRFGSCESASLSFTYDAQVTGSLLGKTVKAFLIPNHHSTEMLLLGVFRVEEEKLSNDRVYRTITAYDAMYDILNADVIDWYNTLLPTASTSVSVTMAQFRASFLNHFGVTAETVNLINDDFIIRRTLDADKESLSGAEVIKAICEFNGVFGMITHEGKFRFLTLLPATTEERTEIARSAYYDLQYEDFYTKQISTLVVYSDYAKATHTGYTQGGVYVISGNFLMAQYNSATLKVLADNIYPKMANAIYKPCSIQTVGNPLHEVGDPIKIITKEGFVNTYIFERRLHGIQALRDTYSANGEINTYQALNSTASRLREINASQAAQAEALANSDTDFVETIRNIGFRLLDEPTNVSAEYNENTGNVEITWTDPDDISTNEPVPCAWAGTVVVRKEDSAPRHRWDGELIVDSTTKDEYSSTALEDSTVQGEKNYFYGIFPYHAASGSIKHYRYTKSVMVETPERPITYEWDEKTWNGLTSFNGNNIWTDDTNIYYSNGSNSQYVLDRQYNRWNAKTWSVINTSFTGQNIWSDGENLYYSNLGEHYVFDRVNGTWSSKTWNGLTTFSGSQIWTDGVNVYRSQGGAGQQVLDKSTSTWSTKTWNGLGYPFASSIWSDGEHIYHSNGNDQHVLDVATSTWHTKTWNGLNPESGMYIWSDGTDIYYSKGSAQYVLDKSTDTWNVKTWDGTAPEYGYHIWHDGEHTYYSYNDAQYELVQST